MINNKYSELIARLIESTKEGRINWDKASRNGEYTADIENYMVSLIMLSTGVFSISRNTADKYVLSLINDQGEYIDTNEIQREDYDYKNVEELYSEARKSYYKVDEVLSTLISTLK